MRASLPAPVLRPLGAWAHVMPRYDVSFVKTGNTVLSQPGRPGGKAKPVERQVPVNDFP
jgi:hypothetical protein